MPLALLRNELQQPFNGALLASGQLLLCQEGVEAPSYDLFRNRADAAKQRCKDSVYEDQAGVFAGCINQVSDVVVQIDVGGLSELVREHSFQVRGSEYIIQLEVSDGIC